jgi:hypothetical protein
MPLDSQAKTAIVLWTVAFPAFLAVLFSIGFGLGLTVAHLLGW